jgi:hypothetical protein
MRILIPSVVAATVLVATSVGWKVEAATMPGVGTLPLQTESYTPVEKVVSDGPSSPELQPDPSLA